MATQVQPSVELRRVRERMNASADDYPRDQRATPPAVTSSALAFKFREGQERWPPGTPGGLGGQWKDDGVPNGNAPTGKLVKPAIIYKKHADGAVVAQRGSRRLRWDAGAKKFSAEEREGDDWVERQKLSKTEAYAEVKDGDWREPGADPPSPAAPSATPEVAEISTDGDDPQPGDEVIVHVKQGKTVLNSEQLRGTLIKKTPTYVLVEATDGLGKKYRTSRTLSKVDRIERIGPASGSKTSSETPELEAPVVEPEVEPGIAVPGRFGLTESDFDGGRAFTRVWSGAAGAEQLDPLNAVNQLQASEDSHNGVGGWWEPVGGENVDFYVEGVPEAVTVEARFLPTTELTESPVQTGWTAPAGSPVLITRMAVTLDGKKHELDVGRGLITKTSDVSNIDNDPWTVNEDYWNSTGIRDKLGGPKMPASEVSEPVDTGVESSEISTDIGSAGGYDGPRFVMPDTVDHAAAAEYESMIRRRILTDHTPGAEKMSYEDQSRIYALRDIFNSHPPAVAVRATQEAQVAGSLDVWARDNGLTVDDQLKADLARQTREAFAGKKIAVRVTPKNLENILTDGRMKTQFEAGKSKGHFDPTFRAAVEAAMFGIDQDIPPGVAATRNPEKRPVYGYVALDGIRPAGIGTGALGEPSTDALSQYGQIQVVLKDDVRRRTTAMFGDSLNNRHGGIPSPVNDPTWQSFTPSWKAMVTRGLTGPTRDGDSTEFRHGQYAEAQIHGGVTLDDVAEVVFPTTPPATLRQQLDDSNVPWRVLNFKTAVTGTPEERANALRIAEQDVAELDAEIARLTEMRAGYEAKNQTYSADSMTKDIKKLQTQRKRIADALPALRGETGKSTPRKTPVKLTPVSTPPTPAVLEAPPPKPVKMPTPEIADGKTRSVKSLKEGEKFTWRDRPMQAEHVASSGGMLWARDLDSGETTIITFDDVVGPARSYDLNDLTLPQTLGEIEMLKRRAAPHERIYSEYSHKMGIGKVLKGDDRVKFERAKNALQKIIEEGALLADRALRQMEEQDIAPWGGTDTQAERERWAATSVLQTTLAPGTDETKLRKVRDSYVVNDLQTVTKNRELRSGNPDKTALSWRTRMNNMVGKSTVDEDSVVYRGAAMSPEVIASLRPGSTLIDPGIMSTDRTRNGADFYADTRQRRQPATVKTIFQIRVPGGTPGIDVDYDEIVFASDTGLRVVDIRRQGQAVEVIAEMIPPKKGKK